MRFPYRCAPAFLALVLLFACQPITTAAQVKILDSGQRYLLQTNEKTPATLLAQAGLVLNPADSVLYLGASVPLNQPLPTAKTYTLQIRRAVPLRLNSGNQSQILQTAAFTVGQALNEAGLQLYAADRLNPPAETPITGAMIVNHTPSRELTVHTGGKALQIRSAAMTVRQALAEAGIPLQGLDYSLPAESDPLPVDGQIRIVHVQESILLVQKSIPFTDDYQASADLELDQQAIIQPGVPGLTVSRVRIRYEDGQEITRQSEGESVVRPPQTRVLGYGTKIAIYTLQTPGGPLQYWRAVQMWATSYSPCRSAADRCYYGTSSGLPVKKGVAALKYSWYIEMGGQQVYIPGYGVATIADVCGGCKGKPWIDLGYGDDDWVEWGDWVTVYFLTPVPPNPNFVLN